MKKQLLVFLCIFFILNMIPVAGFFRALPVYTEESIKPMGSFFRGTPLYTEEILNGEISSYSTWAAGRFLNGENVYDMKPRRQEVDIFPYPPLTLFLGLLFLPLAPFDFYGWFLLLLFSFIGIVFCVEKILREKGVKQTHRILAICAILLGQSIIRNTGWGHYYIIVLGLMFGLYVTKNEWLQGILSGFLNGILIYGYIFLPYLLIKKKYKAVCTSVLVSVLPFIFLFFTNKESFFGFFMFLINATQLGVSMFGTFSFVRFFSSSTVLKLAYLAINALIWLWMTYGFWKGRVKESHYFAFIPVFLLMTEPWFSNHHVMTAIVAYVLLFSPKVLFPFALTELNYQTFASMVIANYILHTYFVFLGVTFMYILIIYKSYIAYEK